MDFYFLSSNVAYSRPAPSEDGLKATFKKMVDVIRESCSKRHPLDDKKFQECATVRHSAMNWYFTTLFKYRDTKGINSIEFKKGIDCAEKYSPTVNEPGRKMALERADWLNVKSCYQKALNR